MTKQSSQKLTPTDRPVLLASSSPRRKELLNKLGLDFKVQPSPVDEITVGDPREVAIENATLKAMDIAQANKDHIVIGADTVVAFQGKIYGKPKDSKDAFSMLSELNGGRHQVISGVAIISINLKRKLVFAGTTEVFMNSSNDETLWKYIHSAKPFDKAGAYGIQDPEQNIIERYIGSFDNVVGFPSELFIEKWSQFAKTESK